MPLTTRPSAMSRQGMMRLASPMESAQTCPLRGRAVYKKNEDPPFSRPHSTLRISAYLPAPRARSLQKKRGPTVLASSFDAPVVLLTLGSLQRRLEIELAFVERAARNRAG